MLVKLKYMTKIKLNSWATGLGEKKNKSVGGGGSH